MRYKLLIYTCFGGCETGVAASKACIRLWEEHQGEVKVGCLPAVVIPGKLREMIQNSDKRILIDACALKCGAKLAERFGLPLDRYLELTTTLHRKKVKQLPSKELEEEVYKLIKREVEALLGQPKTQASPS